jgi:hypothetical protein
VVNAHNLYFKHLRRAWQPILRSDGFGAFNAHHLEIREGYTSKEIFIQKSGFGLRVQLWHAFNGFEVRHVPFSPQSGTSTHIHVLELSPDPEQYAHYTFMYGSSEREVRVAVEVLVDAYMRFARPFFRL